MNEDTRAILWNIVGGIIVGVLISMFAYLRSRISRYQLKRLLGSRLQQDKEIRIVYGQLTLRQLYDSSGQAVTHPYGKASREGGALPLLGMFSMTHPVSECEVRASTYLTSMLSSRRALHPLLVSDIEVDGLLDSSFIALGGPDSNYKTGDILASPGNILATMTGARLALVSGESLPSTCDQTQDHGIILRVTPPQFPRRSWIVCAGLGEWGTSGSAWFLANKWRQLLRTVHWGAYLSLLAPIPDFVAVVRVSPLHGRDQSTEIVTLYRRSGKVIKKVK